MYQATKENTQKWAIATRIDLSFSYRLVRFSVAIANSKSLHLAARCHIDASAF